MAVPIIADADSDMMRPEYMLAGLMQTEMQTQKIDPVALRLFILVHWDEVSRLAHKIHASGPQQKLEKST